MRILGDLLRSRHTHTHTSNVKWFTKHFRLAKLFSLWINCRRFVHLFVDMSFYFLSLSIFVCSLSLWFALSAKRFFYASNRWHSVNYGRLDCMFNVKSHDLWWKCQNVLTSSASFYLSLHFVAQKTKDELFSLFKLFNEKCKTTTKKNTRENLQTFSSSKRHRWLWTQINS